MSISQLKSLINESKTKEVVMCGTKYTKQTKMPTKLPEEIEEMKKTA